MKTESIELFATYIDDFARGLLDAMSVLEEMLDSGEQLEAIEGGTVEELRRLLDQVGEAHCAISDLRVNNLRRIVRAARKEVPALAAAA